MHTHRSVLDQVAVACRRDNRAALAVGTVLGGFVPVATYVVAHHEAVSSPGKWVLVAGGLAYSATTMFQWAREAFGNPVKAAGFVVILEGTAVVSSTEILGITALACLTAVNAAATACSLATEKTRTPRRRSRTVKQTMTGQSALVPNRTRIVAKQQVQTA